MQADFVQGSNTALSWPATLGGGSELGLKKLVKPYLKLEIIQLYLPLVTVYY